MTSTSSSVLSDFLVALDQARDRLGRWTSGHGTAGPAPVTSGGAAGLHAASQARKKERSALDDPEAKAEADVLHRYENTDTHKRVNRTLRDQGARTEKTEQRALADAGTLDRAMDTMGVRNEKEIVVWRGITGPMGRFKVGDTVVDDGFMSTSASRDKAAYFTYGKGVRMRIKVPPGNTMLAGEKKEQELIFPRGRQLEIMKVEKLNQIALVDAVMR